MFQDYHLTQTLAGAGVPAVVQVTNSMAMTVTGMLTANAALSHQRGTVMGLQQMVSSVRCPCPQNCCARKTQTMRGADLSQRAPMQLARITALLLATRCRTLCCDPLCLRIWRFATHRSAVQLVPPVARCCWRGAWRGLATSSQVFGRPDLSALTIIWFGSLQ